VRVCAVRAPCARAELARGVAIPPKTIAVPALNALPRHLVAPVVADYEKSARELRMTPEVRSSKTNTVLRLGEADVAAFTTMPLSPVNISEYVIMQVGCARAPQRSSPERLTRALPAARRALRHRVLCAALRRLPAPVRQLRGGQGNPRRAFASGATASP
jgi:hypothetical protein